MHLFNTADDEKSMHDTKMYVDPLDAPAGLSSSASLFDGSGVALLNAIQ